MRFTVGSLNIHFWRHPTSYASNVSETSLFLSQHPIDVLCLQEVMARRPLDVLAQQHHYQTPECTQNSGFGVAVLSKFPILKSETKNLSEQRVVLYCKIKITESFSLHLFNTHLDHQYEGVRLNQMNEIQQWIKEICPNEPHIMVGDFNALNKADYTSEQWQTISTVRKENMWETPETTLLNRLIRGEETEESGWFSYTDALQSRSDSDADVVTCRFGTRIDTFYLIIFTLHFSQDTSVICAILLTTIAFALNVKSMSK